MTHFELQFTIHYIQLKNNKGQNKIWEFKEHVPTNWTEKIKTVWRYMF